MTLREAATQGIRRVRLPHWANAEDYLLIDIVEGGLGPWAYLYSPLQGTTLTDLPRPQSVIAWLDEETGYEPYTGPLLEQP